MDEENIKEGDNTDLLEQYGLSFDEYLSEGNLEKCREIINQVREISEEDAWSLQQDLNEHNVFLFN